MARMAARVRHIVPHNVGRALALGRVLAQDIHIELSACLPPRCGMTQCARIPALQMTFRD